MPSETPVEISVECYAGHRGEQTPRRFDLHGRRTDVVEVIDAWLAPDHRYFKVTGCDGFTYLLRHDVRTGRWRLAGSAASGAASPSATALRQGS